MRTGLLPPTFTTAAALSRGVHPRNLYAWRDDGQVIELSRGVFRRADAPPASYPDLLAVAYRSPAAIVCLPFGRGTS
ncbi:type IV toxin-antitoxin system AbiEi family antitoxin domain-containing protein [Jatrophihabitans sp.]|uniref:type IV toxin-antitoxin system AbiEi family antitoxin domain-containing protein n=1 Tax=Jatrophihabitans sp. TaxID=1932789 RepID=UPI0038CD9D46